MFARKRKIRTIALIISLVFVFCLILIVFSFPDWVKKTEVSEDRLTYRYDGNTYVADKESNLGWDFYYYAAPHKRIGWGIFWSREFLSYQKENPIYIVSPGLGRYLIAFREDVDVWNTPVILRDKDRYRGQDSEQSFCLSDLIVNEPIAIKPFQNLWLDDDIPYFSVEICMKSYPCIEKTLYILEYEGEYYICLDDSSKQYQNSYYLLSDEYLRFFSDFYGFDFNEH